MKVGPPCLKKKNHMSLGHNKQMLEHFTMDYKELWNIFQQAFTVQPNPGLVAKEHFNIKLGLPKTCKNPR